MVVITARPPAASWHSDVTRFIAVVESSPDPSVREHNQRAGQMGGSLYCCYEHHTLLPLQPLL